MHSHDLAKEDALSAKRSYGIHIVHARHTYEHFITTAYLQKAHVPYAFRQQQTSIAGTSKGVLERASHHCILPLLC